MKFDVLTLFPEMITSALEGSIIGRAQKEGIIEINAVDIRDFSKDRQRHVDDYPYGGGAGMVIKPQPVYDAFKSLEVKENTKVLYMTPQGRPFCQRLAEEFSKEEEIVILCGHYEGIDERVIEEIVTDEVSMGDFVLTGGEIAAMAVIDAVSRLKPGVLGKEESYKEESFSDGLLEYPQYTRPPVFMDKEVPPVLLSGDHGKVDIWRHREALKRTYEKRPDLFEKYVLNTDDRIVMEQYLKNKH
ncbi:MAG: tRNA (guanosine(37)-N1)-methyltransferase TrmD [Clostridia bacterium]|jgi:tRNA (guanine37-N1)-methyltransferase|nr:tRNA (guanosine(37)-N1)-methyltransferase TrmD [Clostridia bacterium]MCI2001035.1 tRNA (guanosine(37)-N1)-methyltransferase TrmD [Clostridia bacterium]MCI2015634.1 tRNA (guanosine(37)-N1)-methyltransferase TrmD [Clostridia bacterium]